ncbi:MAG: RDD family protein [Vicinamibacterales bacterium]
MKCPKCNYLGFETGDRCKNCGYDFSLIVDSDPQPVDIDFDLRSPGADTSGVSDWLMRAEAALAAPTSEVPPVQQSESPPVRPAGTVAIEPRPSNDSRLPLFTRLFGDKGDEPLIKLPVTPRPPLAVRRTPDTPRLRAVSGAVRTVEREPALEFDETARHARKRDALADAPPRPASRVWQESTDTAAGQVSRPAIRLVAAAIDHLLLCAIDLAVIYFTLRIAGLSMGEWAALPPVPLILFLLVLKLAYFCAFTAVGGQTIGKMALRIRVVTESRGPIDAALAVRRTVVGAASTALLGLGFLPAFFDPERRAFHDRVARTRVIALRAG